MKITNPKSLDSSPIFSLILQCMKEWDRGETGYAISEPLIAWVRRNGDLMAARLAKCTYHMRAACKLQGAMSRSALPGGYAERGLNMREWGDRYVGIARDLAVLWYETKR